MSFVKRHPSLFGMALGAVLVALFTFVFDGIPQPLAGMALSFGFAMWFAERGKKRDAVIYTRRAELQEYLKAEELKHRRRREQDSAEG